MARLVIVIMALTVCSAQIVAAQQPTVQAGAGANAATSILRQRVEQLRVKYLLDQVWFRVEIPGRAPMQTATSGDAGVLLPVASVSKSVTGIGIALLIQQGNLRLDATLGEVLSGWLKQRGATLDPSLTGVTIERLLTHRAGLQANASTVPVNGLSSGRIIQRAGGSSDFFKYVAAADGARSNGSSEYAYSNLSYLLLGLVIEAVTGETYSAFCQQNIFTPRGVSDAAIPSNWTIVSPYAGWYVSMADMMRVWDIFDVRSPTVLRRDTLERTLLGRLGGPINANGDVYYTLGVNVLQLRPGAPYVVNHNGIADFMAAEPKVFTFVEKTVPGTTWMIVFNGGRRDIRGDERRNINIDVRAMVKDLEAAQ
jgi:D-alanyl-D-alanine carboxypeptidase